MRVAVVDIGTNSTRLLIAEVEGGRLEELDRRTEVTRLGDGVDATGELNDEAMGRVFGVLEEYRRAIGQAACEATTAVLTSAVRDARNGPAFADRVRERYDLDARTLGGDTEAQLTFRGATAQRDRGDRAPVLVIDIGGGSTELVTGSGTEVSFHVSTQAGVVRQTERHLEDDPPAPAQVRALRQELASLIRSAAPHSVRRSASSAIAVAGTATSSAAIDLQLEPYDPARVEGHVLGLETIERLLQDLAAMSLQERRRVPGLHPDRAPTIVAGVAILLEALDAFGLNQVTVSERDILWGAALELAEA